MAQSKPTTEERISISLPDLLEKLRSLAPESDRKPFEDMLQRANANPELHAQLKSEMLQVVGQDALKQAVAALLSGRSSCSQTIPNALAPSVTSAYETMEVSASAAAVTAATAVPAAAVPAVPVLAPLPMITLPRLAPSTRMAVVPRVVPKASAASSASKALPIPAAAPAPAVSVCPPASASSASEPAIPGPSKDEQLLALFGDLHKEDFKACLIHSFHCHTPSCPIPECGSFTSRLERLHQHVAACSTPECKLCSVWTYLKNYRDTYGAAGACSNAPTEEQLRAGYREMMYPPQLINAAQLLPRLHDGKVSWAMPNLPMSHAQQLPIVPRVAGETAKGEVSIKAPRVMNNKTFGAGDSAANGVRVEKAQPHTRTESVITQPTKRPRTTKSARERGVCVNAFNAPSAAASGASAQGMPPVPTPWDHLAFAQATGAGGAEGPGALPEGVCLERRLSQESLYHSLNALQMPASFGMQKSLSTLGLSPFPLEMCKSVSGICLADVLKSNSLTDLGLAAGLSFSKSKSDLRDRNISECSLGTFLDQNTGGQLNSILEDFEANVCTPY